MKKKVEKTSLDSCLARLFFLGFVWMHCHPLLGGFGCMYRPYWDFGMLIPLEECKRYCEEEVHRGYKKKYWRPITLKIAIA